MLHAQDFGTHLLMRLVDLVEVGLGRHPAPSAIKKYWGNQYFKGLDADRRVDMLVEKLVALRTESFPCTVHAVLDINPGFRRSRNPRTKDLHCS